jgi:hypothetical protein
MSTKECEELFTYSIEKLSAFDAENLPYTISETYAHFVMNYEKEEGESHTSLTKEDKPKRGFFGR